MAGPVRGANHVFRFELGNRLAVLLPAPVDITSLVDGGRRPEELVQMTPGSR